MKFKITEILFRNREVYTLYVKGWFYWAYEAESYNIAELRQRAIDMAAKETIVEEFEE